MMKLLTLTEIDLVSGANIILSIEESEINVILTNSSDTIWFQSGFAYSLSLSGNGVAATGWGQQPLIASETPITVYNIYGKDYLISRTTTSDGYCHFLLAKS